MKEKVIDRCVDNLYNTIEVSISYGTVVICIDDKVNKQCGVICLRKKEVKRIAKALLETL